MSSFAHKSRRAVRHPLEREAVVLLRKAGWSMGELTMTFQCDENAIRRILHEQNSGGITGP